MTTHPAIVRALVSRKAHAMGAQDRTIRRAQLLVLVKVGKGKTVPLALRETTAFVARETDK